MHDHGLNWGHLVLVLALGAGCPADVDDDGETGAAASTGAASSTGGDDSTGAAAGTGGPGSTDPTELTGQSSSAETTSTTDLPTSSSSGGTSESDATSSGDSSSGDSRTGGDSSTGGEPETTGPLEKYACEGYWFAACSFCLQTECMPELQACEEVGGCCCLTSCIAGGYDAELCMGECGVEEYPAAADDLMACKVGECGAGGQCPKD